MPEIEELVRMIMTMKEFAVEVGGVIDEEG
jgi:hypothetical protein